MTSKLPAVAIALAAVGVSCSWHFPPLGLACIFAACLLGVFLSVAFLGKDEQLRIVGFTETTVVNGPAIQVLPPFSYRSAKSVQAKSLTNMDYVKVKDTVGGSIRIEKGPKLLFLGAYDEIVNEGTGVTLNKTEYLVVDDTISGNTSVVKGPAVWFPQPYDNQHPKRMAISLTADEYVRVSDTSTGQRIIVQGKTLFFPEPTQKVEGGIRKAWTLQANEYVRLLDNVSGKITVYKGESTVFPQPHEEALDGDKMQAIELKVDEFVKIMDQTNSKIRVVPGATLVFLGANDKIMDNGKRKAIQVDDQHAVLVRETSSGQLRLVKDNQLFVPGPTENIEEVRDRIMLADHEAMIIKDKDGNLAYHYGNKDSAQHPRSFFVPPHAEIVQLNWSGGKRREKRDLKISRFDIRPQFMWNEIDCRTKDNVELILETTLFWEVVDLSQMVRTTGNLTGDIYNQIRSQFIKHVAQKNLKEFMSDLHLISKAVFKEDPEFYKCRGVKVASLEVTKYTCAEKRTSEVLQQIIEETTDRLNRLSQAESQNEIDIFKMQGQIARAEQEATLLQIAHENTKREAEAQGKAEAERVAAFMKGLQVDVPKLEDRMTVWQTLRKTDALSVVSQGGASLYYTPNDVNLSIKSDGCVKPEA